MKYLKALEELWSGSFHRIYVFNAEANKYWAMIVAESTPKQTKERVNSKSTKNCKTHPNRGVPSAATQACVTSEERWDNKQPNKQFFPIQNEKHEWFNCFSSIFFLSLCCCLNDFNRRITDSLQLMSIGKKATEGNRQLAKSNKNSPERECFMFKF